MSEDNKSKMAVLESCYEQADRTAKPADKKKLADIRKRLNVLYAKMNASEVSQSTLQGLSKICQAMQSGNMDDANRATATLVEEEWDANKEWLPGIRTLITLAKSS